MSGDGDNFQGGGGVQKDDDIFDAPLTSTPRQQSNQASTSFQAGGERRDGAGETASTTAADQRQQGHGYGSNMGGDYIAAII